MVGCECPGDRIRVPPLKELTPMVEIILFFVVAAAYCVYIKRHGLEIVCLAALFFCAIYLWIYLAVPPHLPIKSTYAGQLFGLLPLISLSLILFPQINHKLPTSLTRFLGWFMLLGIGALLVGFKVFVW